MYCPNCNREFVNYEVMCPHCGISLEDEHEHAKKEVNSGTVILDWRRLAIITVIALLIVFALSFITIQAFEFFKPVKYKYFSLEAKSISSVMNDVFKTTQKNAMQFEKYFGRDFVNKATFSVSLDKNNQANADYAEIVNPAKLTLETKYNKKSDWESDNLNLSFNGKDFIGFNCIFDNDNFYLKSPMLFSKTLMLNDTGYKKTLNNLNLVKDNSLPDSLSEFKFTNEQNVNNIKDVESIWKLLVKYRKVFYDNLNDDNVKLNNNVTFSLNGTDTKCNEYVATFDGAYLKKCLLDILDKASKDEKLYNKLKESDILKPLFDMLGVDFENGKAYVNDNRYFTENIKYVNHVYENGGKIIGRNFEVYENDKIIERLSYEMKFTKNDKYFSMKSYEGEIPVLDATFNSNNNNGIETGITKINSSEGFATIKHEIKGLSTDESSIVLKFDVSDGDLPIKGTLSIMGHGTYQDSKSNTKIQLSCNDSMNGNYSFTLDNSYSAEQTQANVVSKDTILDLDKATQQDLSSLQQEMQINGFNLMFKLPEPLSGMFSGLMGIGTDQF